MINPKVSIIVPMYNCEEYIVDCINSVLTQQFEDFEIIIIDDCSKDKSYEICIENFGNQDNIKIFHHKKNTGQGEAINDGIKAARGKYVRILHADDIFMQGALKILYDAAEENNADVVHEIGRYESNEAGGSVIKLGCQIHPVIHDYSPVNKPTLMTNDLNERLKDWFERGTHVDCMYNMFRREFLISNGIRFDESGGNFLFTFYWIMRAKVFIKLPTATYIYRINPSSVTNIKRNVDHLEHIVNSMVDCIHLLDKYMNKLDFFKDKKYLKELVKIEAISIIDGHWIDRLGFYDKNRGGGYVFRRLRRYRKNYEKNFRKELLVTYVSLSFGA